jgi:hypothetical protein
MTFAAAIFEGSKLDREMHQIMRVQTDGIPLLVRRHPKYPDHLIQNPESGEIEVLGERCWGGFELAVVPGANLQAIFDGYLQNRDRIPTYKTMAADGSEQVFPVLGTNRFFDAAPKFLVILMKRTDVELIDITGAIKETKEKTALRRGDQFYELDREKANVPLHSIAYIDGQFFYPIIRKIEDPIDAPEILHLKRDFVRHRKPDGQWEQGQGAAYELCGVVTQRGAYGGGHYVADFKLPTGEYIHGNDMPSQLTPHNLAALKKAADTGYVLVYKIKN